MLLTVLVIWHRLPLIWVTVRLLLEVLVVSCKWIICEGLSGHLMFFEKKKDDVVLKIFLDRIWWNSKKNSMIIEWLWNKAVVAAAVRWMLMIRWALIYICMLSLRTRRRKEEMSREHFFLLVLDPESWMESLYVGIHRLKNRSTFWMWIIRQWRSTLSWRVWLER